MLHVFPGWWEGTGGGFQWQEHEGERCYEVNPMCEAPTRETRPDYNIENLHALLYPVNVWVL